VHKIRKGFPNTFFCPACTCEFTVKDNRTDHSTDGTAPPPWSLARCLGSCQGLVCLARSRFSTYHSLKENFSWRRLHVVLPSIKQYLYQSAFVFLWSLSLLSLPPDAFVLPLCATSLFDSYSPCRTCINMVSLFVSYFLECTTNEASQTIVCTYHVSPGEHSF